MKRLVAHRESPIHRWWPHGRKFQRNIDRVYRRMVAKVLARRISR